TDRQARKIRRACETGDKNFAEEGNRGTAVIRRCSGFLVLGRFLVFCSWSPAAALGERQSERPSDATGWAGAGERRRGAGYKNATPGWAWKSKAWQGLPACRAQGLR